MDTESSESNISSGAIRRLGCKVEHSSSNTVMASTNLTRAPLGHCFVSTKRENEFHPSVCQPIFLDIWGDVLHGQDFLRLRERDEIT